MERICVDHIPKLQTLQAHVERHINHQFTSEMSQNSTVVNLGTVSENPASTAGVIDIMTNLHQYVPSKGNGLHTVVCNGDQLSVERINNSSVKTNCTLVIQLKYPTLFIPAISYSFIFISIL